MKTLTLGTCVGGICSGAVLLTMLAGCGEQLPSVAGSIGQSVPQSSTEKTVYFFRRPLDGMEPYAGLIDVGGTLYGTTESGGASGYGTVYSLTTGGTEKAVYSFAGEPDGSTPVAGLVDVNGTLYGTTEYGGSSGAGTVYSVATSGAEKVLYSFRGGADGSNPFAGLIAVNGTLYGTTEYGGTSGDGTVFSITASGAESVLYTFTGGSDGKNPLAGLTNVNGTLYGTTVNGGTSNDGTVFSVTPSGAEKVLYSFTSSNGSNPYGGLLDVDGMLYGMTNFTGPGAQGAGVVYRITTAGVEKVVYAFTGPDGGNPRGGLIDVRGTLYGTTHNGGGNKCHTYGCGAVFSVTKKGVETRLWTFVPGAGSHPYSSLIYVKGKLYGTTLHGNGGSVFAVTP